MKILKGVLILIIFVGGILIGFFLKNFPLIEWKKEIKIYEVFQVLSTLFVGLVIPFLIKKWIDDSRIVKGLLVEEAKDVIAESKKIRDKLVECHNKKAITEEDKQFIMLQFGQLEYSLTNFEKSLQRSFGQRCNADFQDMKIAYYTYWQNITGNELMREDFTLVNVDFLQFHTIEYNMFQNAIRVFLIAIQKI